MSHPLLRARARAGILSMAASLMAFPGCLREESLDLVPSAGPPVRVQVLTDQAGPVAIRARGAVRILSLPDQVLTFEGSLPDPASVEAEREGFRIAGQYYPSPLRLVSKDSRPLALRVPERSGARGEARPYRGSLDFFNLAGRIRAINELSMEEYLAGVVGGEMPGSFPGAALESQAIASRTYALYHLRASPRKALSEGFAPTPLFQVYGGMSGENSSARRAVLSTAGWVLSYHGRLFPAYYHSTCGGSTAPAASVFGDEDIPPLRGGPCNLCAGSSFHRWTLTLTLRQVEDCLRPWAVAQRVPLGEVRGLEGVEPLAGGYLRYVRVLHSSGSFEIRADRFREKLIRSGLSGLRSTSFEVAPGGAPGTIELRGAGWGHGVGLCQHGAGKRGGGESCGEILAHYFPESELKKVY